MGGEGLRSAELKGRIAFLDLMAMLLLIQPKMSLAFGATEHY